MSYDRALLDHRVVLPRRPPPSSHLLSNNKIENSNIPDATVSQGFIFLINIILLSSVIIKVINYYVLWEQTLLPPPIEFTTSSETSLFTICPEKTVYKSCDDELDNQYSTDKSVHTLRWHLCIANCTATSKAFTSHARVVLFICPPIV